MAKNFFKVTYDILRGVNATIWGGVEGTKKASTIIKSGASVADSVIGVSHAIEDLACKDYVCATMDIAASVASAVSLVVGNFPMTKKYTYITGTVTVSCRTVRFYCKKYGTVWGCTAAIGAGIGKAAQSIKFTL